MAPTAAGGKGARLEYVEAGVCGAVLGPLHVLVEKSQPPLAADVRRRRHRLGVVEALARRVKGAHLPVAAGFFGAFILLLPESPHPLTFSHLLGIVPMAILLGIGAGAARALAGGCLAPSGRAW